MTPVAADLKECQKTHRTLLYWLLGIVLTIAVPTSAGLFGLLFKINSGVEYTKGRVDVLVQQKTTQPIHSGNLARVDTPEK